MAMTVREIDTAVAFQNPHQQREFISNLTDAIAWCTVSGSSSDPASSLRTCKPELDDLLCQSSQVFRVGLKRSQRLREAGRETRPAVTDLCGGRLVAFFPSDSLSDGVAKTHSKGFFDVDNVPPYDTWVWMARNVRRREYDDHTTGEIEANYLVAWVPPNFIELADAGIEANDPECCIRWLDEVDDDFVRSLRNMNFLPDLPVGAIAPGI
jgi:hypothetical protein